jgi:hypothetical protein
MTVDGTPVVWASNKEPSVTKSTPAEVGTTVMAADEAILVQKIVSDVCELHRPIR